MTHEDEPRTRLGRRRFLQGAAAAATVAALPLPRATAASCDPFSTPPVFAGGVTDPDVFLGFTLGVDREVTSAEADAYIKRVAADSNRVVTARYGNTWQGRPLRYAIVGKPQNVTPAGLEKVRQANLRIRDPRTPAHAVSRLAVSTPAIAWVIANIHGSEESGADMSLRLLYELADRTDCVATTLLDNLVIVVIPVQNPDGREADTRRNAYGFDLNRDVFARTQPETDSRVELMRSYPPVLLLDDHEFGYYRSFFPPDADPVYHEVSETSMRWIEDVYGAAISRQFRKEGEVFFHGGIYDFFAPQYNDTGSAFGFGAAGMTIEVYNGAPLERRVHRHYTVAMASLWQAANRRASVLRGLHGLFEEALAEGRKGILERNRRYFKPNRPVRTPVPTTPLRHYFIEDAAGPKGDDVRRLVRRLQRMDVDVYRLQEPLEVPDYRPYGRSARRTRLAKGTLWIPMAQPQKHWIQAILNEAPYMPTTYTYGLAGWSSPLLMSLDGGYSGAKLRPHAALVKPVKAPAPRKLPSPLPKIGVYQMSVGSYAEESVGATRWLFDNVWGLPYTYLTEDDIRAGGLRHLDVLVAPGGDWPTALRRLGPAGKKALVRFVNGGGRYVGYRGGGAKLAAVLGLTTAVLHDPTADVPGSVVRVEVDQDSPLAKNVGRLAHVLFDSDDMMIASKAIAPVRFPTGASGDFFVSGFASGEEQLYGTAAVVDEFVGKGRVILMPSDPNHSGHVEGMTRLLWNAVLGPDPKRRAATPEAGAPARRAAEDRARRAVTSRPDWPGAFRLTVAEADEAEAAALLRGFHLEFQVRRAGGRSRFLIANPQQWSLEEHPHGVELVLALQRSGMDVVAFSAP